MAGLRIGQVASRAGVSTATIRYYERAALMPTPARSEAGYRLYSARAVDELMFIRRAQGIGFSLGEIRGLLRLSRSGVAPCGRVISLAERHLAQVDERIHQLQTFRDGLAAALERWRSGRCGIASQGLCELLEDASAIRVPSGPAAAVHGPRRTLQSRRGVPSSGSESPSRRE